MFYILHRLVKNNMVSAENVLEFHNISQFTPYYCINMKFLVYQIIKNLTIKFKYLTHSMYINFL